jgi:hypothetical protein
LISTREGLDQVDEVDQSWRAQHARRAAGLDEEIRLWGADSPHAIENV